MKRHRKAWRAATVELDDPSPSVAPLVDVSFLLLIYFVVTTTIQRKERDLDLGLGGEAPHRESVPVQAIVVGVEGDGKVVLSPGRGEVLVSADAGSRELTVLEEHLAMVRLMAVDREPVVQLRVAEGVRQQRVVDVLNCLAKAGVTTVGLVD